MTQSTNKPSKSNKTHGLYLGVANNFAELSKANRKKVGAVIVTKSGVILGGYNGTPSGCDNTCEDENGNTKPSVIHAELNCILKAAREGVSVVDSICYTTLAPCLQCSAMLLQAGIREVHYIEDYRDTSGVELLKQKILVEKHN